MIQELSLNMHYNIGADLLTYLTPASRPVFDVKNGFIEALTGAGLGIEVDEEKVRKADLLGGKGCGGKEGTGEAWRNAMFKGPDGALREW